MISHRKKRAKSSSKSTNDFKEFRDLISSFNLLNSFLSLLTLNSDSDISLASLEKLHPQINYVNLSQIAVICSFLNINIIQDQLFLSFEPTTIKKLDKLIKHRNSLFEIDVSKFCDSNASESVDLLSDLCKTSLPCMQEVVSLEPLASIIETIDLMNFSNFSKSNVIDLHSTPAHDVTYCIYI